MPTQNTRRDFIKTTGCLTIGFTLGGWVTAVARQSQELPESLKRNPAINAWLEVLEDGRVRVFTGKLELGQGIRTAIAQVAAEELYLPVSSVEVMLAETGRTPNEGYTAGSGSIENSAMAIRYAAAAARQKLLELAASKLKTPVESLRLDNGKVIARSAHPPITFAALLEGRQLTDEVRGPVQLKPKDRYRVSGKPIHREDISRMVRGEAMYVQDLRFPNMVHARIIRPPAYGAQLAQADEQGLADKAPGLLKTVVNGSFIGVIAADEYTAIQAQLLLRQQLKWTGGKTLPAVKGDALADHLLSLPARTQEVRSKGSISGEASLKARYFKPYIMHGSIGPSCAVALYEGQQLHVWTHSQGVYPLRTALQKMLDLPEERIHVKGVPGSGCYGHNGADDVAADVALLAMAYPGKHVRLQWSREEEHGWEPFGSAMVMEVAAQLDAGGKISSWQYDVWSDTHSTRPGGNAENLLAAQYLKTPFNKKTSGFSGGAYRNAEPYYTIPNQRINAHFFDGPLRVSALRSLGAYANVFAIECFMDELALKAGKDPYEFRLMHLEDERARAVIQKLRELTKGKEQAGTGTGIAFARYKNSATYCAVAARVAVNVETGAVQVQHMWAAIDAGEVINPDGISNQTEGGMIQSASWTLQEQVQFSEQHITSLDWASYPIFRFNQVPEAEVAIIDRPAEEVLGAGEAAQGPAGAAVANAIYKACGKRIRYLPVLPEKIRG
jgi:nicotinate dehydrogenase subunit B